MEFLEASIFQKGYIDGITILNLDGEILFSAKFNKKLSNLDESQQLIGQKFLDVYPNLTPQSSTLYRAMQFGRPVYEEKQYLKKRGKDGILITSISFPIKNGDRIVGAIDLSMQESEEEEDELPEGRIELSRDSFHRDRTQKLSASASAAFHTEDIIAVDQKMRQAKDYISVVASCDLPVMLCGETGTGKDVFAQAIHNASVRRDGPFIAQNCAAIPDTLLESILFGTAKGAFTGAVETKGLLELADHGTLFLDELNSMPIYLQSKLLRVLQDGTFRSIGSTEVKRSDLKIIAALNQDPIHEIACGHLRQDIYYRLSIMSISIPPLRERKEDIQSFVETFIKRHNKTFQKQIRYVSHELIQRLQDYDWPGNVRELEHIVERLCTINNNRTITMKSCGFLQELVQQSVHANPDGSASALTPSGLQTPLSTAPNISAAQSKVPISTSSQTSELSWNDLSRKIQNTEKEAIIQALLQTNGNKAKAARLLNIDRSSLYYKLKKYNITE